MNARLTISVCTIMRNEEARVEDFLRSLEGFADEIVVVDTGSSDGTVAVVEAYKAAHPRAPIILATYRRSKGFHYGEAKNFSLDSAQGDYCLILDADERLTDDFKNTVREFLERERPEVASVVRQDELLPHLVDYPERLVRRESGIHYGEGPRYQVHEQLMHEATAAAFGGVLTHQQRWNHYCVRPQRILYQLELQIDRTPKTKSLFGHWVRGVWYFFYRFSKIYFKRGLWRDGKLGFKYAFMRAIDAFLMQLFVGLKPPTAGKTGRTTGSQSHPNV